MKTAMDSSQPMTGVATPKTKLGNKSPKSVKKSPGMMESPGKTPGKIPRKTPGKTPNKTPGKTPNKTPDKTSSKTPGKTPNKTPGKTPNKTTGKSPNKTLGKTLGKTPGKTPDKNRKRNLSNEEREATSPAAKVQAVASDMDKPTLPNSVSRSNKKKKLRKTKNKGSQLPQFTLMFKAPTISLFDPATKELLEVLSKAKDVRVNRSFSVTCEEAKEKEQLTSTLKKLEHSNTYSILPGNPKKAKSASCILFAVGLPPDTTRKDLKNVFQNAKSFKIFTKFHNREMRRFAKVTYKVPKYVQELMKHKKIKICGKNVPLVASLDDLKQNSKTSSHPKTEEERTQEEEIENSSHAIEKSVTAPRMLLWGPTYLLKRIQNEAEVNGEEAKAEEKVKKKSSKGMWEDDSDEDFYLEDVDSDN